MKLRVEVPKVFEKLLPPMRYKAAFGGRGGAKSHFFAEQIILRCYQRKTDVVCVREVQLTIKESVKKLLEEKIIKFGLENAFKITDNEIRCIHNDSYIIFRGMQSYNATNLKSLEGFDVCWVEEAQTLSSVSLRLLRPTIRKPGSEIWFSWNPRYKNDPVDKFFRPVPPDNASVVHVNWNDNPWFPDVLKDEMKIDFANDEAMADHIWNGHYEVVTEGAYYAKLIYQAEKEGRITNVPYNPDEPVYTSWDLGLDDHTVVWFVQIIGPAVHVIDYLEVRDTGLVTDPDGQSVANFILRKPYVYAEHYFPHDVEVRNLLTKQTRKRDLEQAGLKPIRAGSALPIVDGINAGRKMLAKSYFDADKTEPGIERLRHYRVEFDEELDTNKPKPMKNGAQHTADAWRELAVNLFDVKRRNSHQRTAEIEYDIHAEDYGERSSRRRGRTTGMDDYDHEAY